MVKEKVLKEMKTTLIFVGCSRYILIPTKIYNDTSFPFKKYFFDDKKIFAKLKIKMFKDKLVVEEE